METELYSGSNNLKIFALIVFIKDHTWFRSRLNNSPHIRTKIVAPMLIHDHRSLCCYFLPSKWFEVVSFWNLFVSQLRDLAGENVEKWHHQPFIHLLNLSISMPILSHISLSCHRWPHHHHATFDIMNQPILIHKVVVVFQRNVIMHMFYKLLRYQTLPWATGTYYSCVISRILTDRSIQWHS